MVFASHGVRISCPTCASQKSRSPVSMATWPFVMPPSPGLQDGGGSTLSAGCCFALQAVAARTEIDRPRSVERPLRRPEVAHVQTGGNPSRPSAGTCAPWTAQMRTRHDRLHRLHHDAQSPADPRDLFHPLQIPFRPPHRNGRSDRTSAASEPDADVPPRGDGSARRPTVPAIPRETAAGVSRSR